MVGFSWGRISKIYKNKIQFQFSSPDVREVGWDDDVINRFVFVLMEVELLATFTTLLIAVADDNVDAAVEDVEVVVSNSVCGSIVSKNGFANAAPVAK